MIVHFKENCPHVESSNFFPLDDFKNLDFPNLKCENCDEKKELWICLFCGKAFCSRYINSHFLAHNASNPEHGICLSIYDLSVWCYDCMDINAKEDQSEEEKKGCYIKSNKTDEYARIYYDYKFPPEEIAKKEKEKEKKENISYNELYLNEVKESKDLCQHIKDITKEKCEKSPFINGVNDFNKISEEIIFDDLCFDCGVKINNYDKLKSHHSDKNIISTSI